jgi:hypothetical protein
MYLFPLELTELVPTKEGFGMSENLRTRLREKNCFNPDPAPPDNGSSGGGGGGGGGGTDPSGNTTDSSGNTTGSGGGGGGGGGGTEYPFAEADKETGVCASIFFDELGKTFVELFDTMDAKLNEFGILIRNFEPMPTGWTFMEDIDAAKDALESIKETYTLSDGTKDKYESLVASFQQFDTLIEKIKTNTKNAKDAFQTAANSVEETFPMQGFFTNPGVSDKETIRAASRMMEDGATLMNELETSLSMFKNERGLYSGDLLEEYDRINDGKGLFAEKELVARQKAETDAALAKTTAASAASVQAAQNPGFFQSILNSIIYSDPTENPAFVYLNKPYQNATLEQVRQIVFYFIYATIFGSIVYFLSTKTFVMPFFQTFLFWTKRYFVFILWILVVAMVYSFTTNWFMWLIREVIRYFAFVMDPTLHPGVHSIWNSKYQQWIKYIVYGVATLGFFLAALFLTVIILFLVLPLFLLLIWASGQLMSYFEKDELDE